MNKSLQLELPAHRRAISDLWSRKKLKKAPLWTLFIQSCGAVFVFHDNQRALKITKGHRPPNQTSAHVRLICSQGQRDVISIAVSTALTVFEVQVEEAGAAQMAKF